MKKLIYFHGNGCPFCAAIEPAVEKLEKEGGVEFERLEVWKGGKTEKEYNKENQARMDSLKHHYDANCSGYMIVPSFYDAESDRLICNPGSYENLKEWIFGK
ncbi:MAG: hypothetical protein AAB527_02615 [Patescibacteria group bacterium]